MPEVTAAVTALRTDLRAAHFGTDAINALLGDVAARALHREQLLPASRACRSTEALSVLVRLFSLGLPVRRDGVADALPSCGVAGLTELGLVASDGDLVRATCDLRPYGDEQYTWWLTSDLSQTITGRPLPSDHALGIGGASTTLASWTPRRPVRRALDLGTGCGVQALHLLTHAEQVVATDLSVRALQYARFNLALNGAEVDLRPGSLLDPVDGEVFDLVVSNPPS